MAKKTTSKSTSTPKKTASKKAVKVKSAAVAKKIPTKRADKPMRKVAPKAKSAGKPVKIKVRKPVVTVQAVGETKPVTAVKPGKNQAGLHKKELEHFRDLLLAKRRELLGDVSSMEDEALRNAGNSNLSNLPIHMADMGTDNYEQEFTLGLVEKDRNLLREINSALSKIQTGTFGICEGTGKPISMPRLEAQPWTRFSIEYARRLEQGRLRR